MFKLSSYEYLSHLAQNEIDNKVEKYEGLKVSQIKEMLLLSNKDNKASFVKLARTMLNSTNNQFVLCDGQVEAVLKTIRVTGNEQPAEPMSFMPVDFDEWATCKSWNQCSLYKYFKEKYFILFIFQQFPLGKRVDDDEMTFLNAKIWKMSDYDLNHGLKEVWEEVRNLIINDKVIITPVTQRGGKIINKNNLPTSKFNYLGHLRPGGTNGNDQLQLPTGQYIAKLRFNFNQNYVKEIINL